MEIDCNNLFVNFYLKLSHSFVTQAFDNCAHIFRPKFLKIFIEGVKHVCKLSLSSELVVLLLRAQRATNRLRGGNREQTKPNLTKVFGGENVSTYISLISWCATLRRDV